MESATCFRVVLGVTFVATWLFLAASTHPAERYILMAALAGEILAIVGELNGKTWVSQTAHVIFAVVLILSVFYVKQTCLMYFLVGMVVVREVTRIVYGKCIFEHRLERPTNHVQAGIIHAAFFAVGSVFVFKLLQQQNLHPHAGGDLVGTVGPLVQR